ncbi:hypothetical protein ACFSKY_16755 [Azotobacter chroococcum]|uniref:hypothetical protein n=2 Tax=Azotobacter chroococcum TaxID=353 RepID=UPI0010397D5D|nr:hypothetical protein [Azotobacter chroococcum]TBW00181.1 hypothetical protein E0E53_00090 [Azotobacter chroococcum]
MELPFFEQSSAQAGNIGANSDFPKVRLDNFFEALIKLLDECFLVFQKTPASLKEKLSGQPGYIQCYQ